MRAILNRTAAIVGAVLVSIFTVMMVLVLVQVINRYALGLPLFWTEEVVRMLLVWCVMIGLPLVMHHRREVRADIMTFPDPRRERWRRRAGSALSLLFLTLLAFYGWQFLLRTIPTMSPTLGISRGWFVAPIPIGSALAVLVILMRAQEDHIARDRS